jgi:hypothetical protein
MVVWRLPCESKSSPAFKYNTPQPNGWGCFFIGLRKCEIIVNFVGTPPENILRKLWR